MRLPLNQKTAILLHEGLSGTQGKTGLSILRYSEAPIVAVIDRESVGKSLSELTGIKRDVPIVASVAATFQYMPEVLVIGIAPKGGLVPDNYWPDIKEALKGGMSLVNGLHTPLANIPELNALLKPGQLIWDVRKEPANLDVASGLARTLPCRRVLTVGTDMAIGKMSTSLELHWAAKLRGWRSKFLATGQTGLMLEGDGVALDAVRVDFAAGAVEQLVMRFGKHYDILQIEGQGSLLHPGSTATLPLIRGSQPTHLVLVHQAGQTHNRNNPHVPIPPLPEVIKMYEMVASAAGAFAKVPVVGIALNTRNLDEAEARSAIAQTTIETGLPCTDPVRFDAGLLLDAVMRG
ncbi:DUF1611 domain-containing protein [Anabaena cylindrica FACHB-243]|uniref:DUF1611 domain-containing protein n=1 Tax=Anabaena cylindrica (strain ATCC 27899 / PCC 7122) TaxID=272123 RepID=K9ZC20_ANACC|nr:MULTISPECIES: DUF1611 domain-containing protein [Anabaena]AFZ56701.1 protein of unknown function DUF1611 [Anabaena cylindrica PCC 7122]MBD2419419.1 DUF1611 domain-containing protein [Anabaena cylindrica FACHB-243]MBY5283181.1 DUF1611 domain-containing protein [Anabaena sp. CCAP 1446/1C]MBY5310728.1 DUF1611 domain-containing protein [Anabaena sp. CCAP 1446/1C]MCM2408959.1 DUF1611 domain-containing protein [Anabaena sp. CCAP 1446/1C]